MLLQRSRLSRVVTLHALMSRVAGAVVDAPQSMSAKPPTFARTPEAPCYAVILSCHPPAEIVVTDEWFTEGVSPFVPDFILGFRWCSSWNRDMSPTSPPNPEFEAGRKSHCRAALRRA